MSDERPTARGEIDLPTLREGFAALACEPEAEAPAEGDHPEPDTIYAAVQGELSPGALRDVVEHMAACPRCAEEWRLAMAFAEEAEEAEVGESPRRAAAPSRPALRLVPIAAALVVAVLAAGVWLTVGQSPEQTAPVYREAPSAGDIVSLLPEGEPLDRSNPVLRWRLGEEGAPEGTTYDVVVSAGDYTNAAEDLQSPSYTLPREALEELPPGTELQWTVDAHLPDGQRSRSALFVTRLP